MPEAFTGLNRIPILMIGPLLHLTGEAFVPLVGGDPIGRRPVDFHVAALARARRRGRGGAGRDHGPGVAAARRADRPAVPERGRHRDGAAVRGAGRGQDGAAQRGHRTRGGGRLPQAPAGTKGISLFIVPKFNVDDEGNLQDRNQVVCSAIEHKMGIHGNATCVLNFDGAQGYLIGPENRGLNCMFTFMNTARIGTAVQGLAASEISFQGALSYAKERLAMRSLSGPKYPEKNADPIIVHPAVRSMLMTQKAFAEGGRALAYFLAQHVDIVESSADQEQQKQSDNLLAFLTPIAKAFLTESGNESAKHGVQVFGGHGFIVEHGMEQIVRDARISTLYEGTTEIQSLDLLARKVLKSEGKLLKNMTDLIDQFIIQHQSNEVLKPYLEKLGELKQQWLSLTKTIAEKAKHNPEEIGAASVDYLYFSSYVVFAYLWVRMAQVAHEKLEAGTQEEAFYKAKLSTAKFFYQKLLHRTQSHAAAIESGAESVMELDQEDFAF